MKVYRIVAKELSKNSYDGKGGLHYSGRWSNTGYRIVYTSATPSLAALEILARVDKSQLKKEYAIIPASIPDKLKIIQLNIDDLPRNWKGYPAPARLKELGTDWLIKLKSAVLSVPSAVMPIERNYLLNPLHPAFKNISIEKPIPFRFDTRLK